MFGINIWGREGCGICKRFMKRLDDMGFLYNKHDIDKKIVHHDGWKSDGSVSVLAAMHCYNNSYPPVIEINGIFMSFAGAINFLKGVKDGKA